MKYAVIQSLVLPAGTLVTLDAAQADARRHALRAVKGMQFEALAAVTFKRGEVIDLDAPAKHLIASLSAVEAPRKPRAPKAAAEPSPASELDLDPIPPVSVGND
jgi:hypothetical protein